MSKNILLLAAVGAAVLLVVQKQAQARAAATSPAATAGGMTAAQMQAAGLLYTPAQTQTVNMNGDMWARLLGDGWRNMTGSQNADGSPAFVKNSWGQVTTSDGKPVAGDDPQAGYAQVLSGLPTGSFGFDYLSTISPYDSFIDGSSVMGW